MNFKAEETIRIILITILLGWEVNLLNYIISLFKSLGAYCLVEQVVGIMNISIIILPQLASVATWIGRQLSGKM
jgi:hypothetical protein